MKVTEAHDHAEGCWLLGVENFDVRQKLAHGRKGGTFRGEGLLKWGERGTRRVRTPSG